MPAGPGGPVAAGPVIKPAKPPAPRPAAPPPVTDASSSRGYTSNMPKATPAAPPPVTDASSSRGTYGVQAANAFKQTPQYKSAVMSVFKAQPAAQQKAIIKGAILSQTPEAKIVLKAIAPADKNLWAPAKLPDGLLKNVYSMPLPKQMDALGTIAQKYGYVTEAEKILSSYGINIPWSQLIARDAAPADKAAIAHVTATVRGTQALQQTGQGLDTARAAQQAALMSKGYSRQALTGSTLKAAPKGTVQGSGLLATVTSDLGLNPATVAASLGQAAHIAGVTGKFLSQPAVNAAKDAVELPAEAYSSVAIPVSDVLQGKFKQAAESVISPFEQAFTHPLQMLSQHPLDTYLMASGVLHGASRLAAAPLRAAAPAESALGRALSTGREPVALTGNLTSERPSFSKSPTMKAGQVAVEKAAYTRAPTGELVPRSENLRDTLISRGVNSLVSARERIRRYNRESVRQARESAVRPSVPARVLQAAKATLKYDPKAPVIPGGDVLSRIADATIRRPDTIVEDLQKHLQQVSAHRPNLLDNPKLLAEHDSYVKALSKALNNKAFLKNPAGAFAAAEKYRLDYTPTEAAASQLGHFGDMTQQALQRRTLMHYAITHMDARLDPERGLLNAEGHPLSNDAILSHLRSDQGTGGRLPAYTPDRPKSGSAYYVSSERRPLPATAKNTLFAYTHGLTDPTHQALTEQHVELQGIVDSHRAQNEYLNTLAIKRRDGGYYPTHKAALADAPPGGRYVPINVSQTFHPADALSQALKDTHPAALEEEAARRSLDLRERMRPDSPGGRWALIDKHAVEALRRQQNLISPNPILRAVRGLNTQFRQVALGTSAKHIPGVTAENVIRDIANGVGVRSWVTGRRMLAKAQELNPKEGAELRPRLTGGQLAGATDFARTHSTAEFYRGTNLYYPLKGFEAMMRSPGPRQLRTLWKAWTRFVIQGTKHVLEEQHQIAGLGKVALREHGYTEAATHGFVATAQRALGLHGQMLDDAARGLFDPAKVRQFRGEINRMYGNWTDLSPAAKWGLMMSPFGLWWVNSVRFLARLPIDQPVKTGLLAATTVGTEKQRQQEGLSMFGPNRLPAYMQGGIPASGGVVAENYYSPFGVANDPLATASSLIQPWLSPVLSAAAGPGLNWLGKPFTSPQAPRGVKNANIGQRLQYILDSALASFVPLYSKAQQLVAGGGKQYDVGGNLFFPPTKPGTSKGLGVGAAKAFNPLRHYKTPTSSTSSGGGSNAGLTGVPGGVNAGFGGGGGGVNAGF